MSHGRENGHSTLIANGIRSGQRNVQSLFLAGICVWSSIEKLLAPACGG